MKDGKRWMVVATYAAAMAWVESAVVYYLRSMVQRIEPYQANPLPIAGGFGFAEMVREAATLVMIFTVGVLAGRNWRARLGYSAVAFGVWDIFYYVFLKVMCDWPHSIWDWDVLFLLPLPWWGPVIAPVSIALLMIFWGSLASGWDLEPARDGSDWKAWTLNTIGVVLALYVFMTDTLRAAPGGTDALRVVLPVRFNWPLFSLALVFMAAPIVNVLRLMLRQSWLWQSSVDHGRWLNHFERNRQHRPEPDWQGLAAQASQVPAPVLRSLEQFQLGDGGGPASLVARDAWKFRERTADQRALVDAWFAEEREHSRLLGCAVDALGGKRITRHWSFSAFCFCRRVLGVRFELQVLLLTEITSTAYYRLLQRHSPLEPLIAMCSLILRDEGGHVAYHRDRLAAGHGRATNWPGLLWAAQFRLGGYAAATMLWINHRRCLTTLGGTTPEFYREVSLELSRFMQLLAAQSAQAHQSAAPERSPVAEREEASLAK